MKLDCLQNQLSDTLVRQSKRKLKVSETYVKLISFVFRSDCKHMHIEFWTVLSILQRGGSLSKTKNLTPKLTYNYYEFRNERASELHNIDMWI